MELLYHKLFIITALCCGIVVCGRFPYKDLYGTKITTMGLVLCTHKFPVKLCGCSDGCELTNSCCIDKYWNDTYKGNMKSYISLVLSKENKEYTEKKKRLEFQQIIPQACVDRYNLKFKIDNQYMISTCSKTSTSRDRILCEDKLQTSILFSIPVRDHLGMYYKNSFCAKCNNVQDFKHVDLTVICPSNIKNSSLNTDLENVKDMSKCWLTFDPLTRKKTCIITVTAQCSSMHNDYELCFAYSGTFLASKNYHCSRCTKHKSNCRKFFIRWSMLGRFTNNNNLKTLKVKIKSKAGTPLEIGYHNVKSCTGDKIYDIGLNKCIEFFCNTGYKKIKTRCVIEKQNSPIISTIPINCKQHLNQSVHIKMKTSNVSAFEQAFISDIFELPNNTMLKQISLNTYSFQDSHLINQDTNITSNTKLEQILQRHINIWNYVEQISIVTLNAKESLKHVNDSQSKCAMTEDIPVIASSTDDCTFKHHNMTLRTGEYVQFQIFSKNKSEKYLTICKKHYLNSNCQLQLLNNSNYRILKNDNDDSDDQLTLIDLLTGDRYNVDEYTHVGNTVAICIKTASQLIDKQRLRWRHTVDDIEVYTTMIGTPISIFFVGFLIVFLIKDKDRYAVPKMNNFAFCIALLLSDCLFLATIFAKDNKIACTAIGVCLHWALLVLNLFIAIIAWDFSMMLSKLKTSKFHGKYCFLKYCFLAILTPTIIVVILIVLDKTNIKYVGYGDQQSCWINDWITRLITYTIPVILICLFSSVLLWLAVRNIDEVNKNNQSAMHKKQKQRYGARKIALRLVLFLGLLEVVQIIEIPNVNGLSERKLIFNAVFHVLYTTLRSFRGFIVWVLLFLLNEQRGNIIKRLSKRKS